VWFTFEGRTAFGYRRCWLLVVKVLLLTVMLKMGFCCLFVMMHCMQMMSVCDMSMVRGFLVIAGLMVFSCFLMMTSGVLVVFGGFSMVFGCLF
jgi:hypothetical protein